MNPLLSSLIGAGVRWALTMLAARGVVVSDDQSVQLVSGAVALAMLVWSVFHKSKVNQAIKDAKAGY